MSFLLLATRRVVLEYAGNPTIKHFFYFFIENNMSFQHRTAAEMEEDTEAAKVAMRKLKIEANAALKAELSGKGGAKIIKKKMVEKGKAFGARKKIDGGGAAAAAADAGADASDGGEGEAAEGAGVVDVPEAAASVAESGAAACAAAEGGAAEEDDVLEEDDYERVIGILSLPFCSQRHLHSLSLVRSFVFSTYPQRTDSPLWCAARVLRQYQHVKLLDGHIFSTCLSVLPFQHPEISTNT